MEPFLIVGHTTARSTQVWLRGGTGHRSVRVALQRSGGRARDDPDSQLLALRRSRDFTATAAFEPLDADKSYEVTAHFRRTPRALDFLRSEAAGARLDGKLRTFPKPTCDDEFDFLLGSCNLSIVSLTHLGGLAATGLGLTAARRSLQRRPEHRPAPLRWAWPVLRAVIGPVLRWGLIGLYWLTRCEQPKPILPSPFRGLIDRGTTAADPDAKSQATAREPPAFAIHAGDQIYFDVPLPHRKPSLEEYRRTYRQAWSEDPALRCFLARCPQYMILDDHEIVDNFAADSLPDWLSGEAQASRGSGGRRPEDYLGPALRAYREYVHARHPSRGDSEHGPLFYDFAYGVSRFFVLDTRTQRFRHRGEMIDAEQMQALQDWLWLHRDALKFVVSSVPFVAELQPKRRAAGNAAESAAPLSNQLPDKWCDEPYRRQRDEIIEFLFEKEIGRTLFLAGDMHCSYHASMRVGGPGTRLTLHELASGPIHQLEFARRDDFCGTYRGTTSRSKLPFTTCLRRIHAAAGNVVRVTARPRSRDLTWEVHPTHSVLGTHSDPNGASKRERGASGFAASNDEPAPLRGRILLGEIQCRSRIESTTRS